MLGSRAARSSGRTRWPVDDRQVREQRADPLGERLPALRTELLRAEVRLRFEDAEPVAPAQEGEEVVGVVEVERKLVVPRESGR